MNISKDCPAGDPNTALMYGISQIARDNNYKVLLVGEGGDEIGGYPVYSQLMLLNKIFKFIPKPFIKILKLLPRNSLTRKIHRTVDSPLYVVRFILDFLKTKRRYFGRKNHIIHMILLRN